MKLLLDQGLPQSTVSHLATAGITATHVASLGMAATDDSVILEYARVNGFVVVTLDADFHQLLAREHANLPSVIRIRIERLRGERHAAILVQVMAIAEAELQSGAVVSVTTDRIRVRSLPIV